MDAACDLWFLITVLSTLCTPLTKPDGSLEKQKSAILHRFTTYTLPYLLLPAVPFYLCEVLHQLPIWVGTVAGPCSTGSRNQSPMPLKHRHWFFPCRPNAMRCALLLSMARLLRSPRFGGSPS